MLSSTYYRWWPQDVEAFLHSRNAVAAKLEPVEARIITEAHRTKAPVDGEPAAHLGLVVDVAFAGDVDDDSVDGASGEGERPLVVGGDG